METCTIVCSYVTGVALMILGGFYIYAKYKLSYWSRRGVKSPAAAHLLFGNMKDLIFFKKTPGQLFSDIYESVESDEPFVGCYLFHKPLLVLRSPELIKQLMIKDFEVFPNRGFGGESEADTIGYVSLLGIRQPRWKYLRSKLTPCLTGRKLRGMLPLVIDCTKNLMRHVDSREPRADGTKFFELKDVAGRYCTDVFASTAFGITTDTFDENNTEFWRAGQSVLAGWKRGLIIIIHFILPELIPLTSLVSKAPAKFFRDIFWDSFDARERLGNARGDLIDSMMALKNAEQNPEFVFEGDNLVAQAVSFFVAGFEATSTAIGFALYDLSRNPMYEARLYEEIERIVGKDQLTMDMLGEMTFLEKCLNESLRLHPPLPLDDRVSVRDYKIPGTDVILEKGSTIYVATCGTNMDPRFFKDPQIYNPLRTDAESLGFSAAHVSFGIGPRSCIGQRFGLVIAKVAIIEILRKYRLVDDSSKDRHLRTGSVFTTAVDGIPLRMRERH